MTRNITHWINGKPWEGAHSSATAQYAVAPEVADAYTHAAVADEYAHATGDEYAPSAAEHYAQRYGEVFDPSTGRVSATVAFASPADVGEAVASAAAAFPGWRETSLAKRATVLF